MAVVDAAARKSTRLVNEQRRFRDGVVPTQEYNANKKAAAKADAAAPAADAPKKKKKRRDSEDAGERKKRKKSKKSKDKA